MKKMGALLIVVLILFWGAFSYGAVTLDLMSPTKFMRDKGKPGTETVNFTSGFGGPATLKLINGSLENPSVPKISSATISLNGKAVFGPSDFNQNVSQLQKGVLLNKGSNKLEVSLNSKPGAEVTIQIFQTLSNVKVIPPSLSLGEAGNTAQLKVTGKLSNGTEVDITGSSFGTVYSSQNSGIANVTNGGLVTAVAYGQTNLTITNDDFLGSVPVAVRGTSPVLSDLLLSRTLLPVPREYEQFILTLMFNFSDPNLDIKSYNFTLTGPSGIIQSRSDALTSDQPTGSSSRKFLIDSSLGEGLYHVGIEILDEMGNSSGTQTVPFNIDPGAEKFFEITGIEPSTGKPGDKVVINGIGFEAETQANSVSFVSALGRAEVLSATGTQLEVIVPEGTRTGTVGLMTSLGRTDSLSPFTIVPTISLSPASTQLLTGSSADFSCVPSGTDTYKIVWSINGQTAPDPFLGAIDNRGHFTAPSSLPSVNPLTLRCTSFDVPTLYAEAGIMVVAPAPKPGQDLVQSAIGGQMTSIWGEVALNIPPGSMATDTVISVEWINPDTLPLPTENSYNLAAVRLEPSGLQFSKPVTVVFSLRSWQEPGTILAVYLVDETTGTLSDTGKTAMVDETGIKASTAITHFSMYFLSQLMTPFQVQVNKYFQTHISDVTPYFNQFSIYTSQERPFLEGLVVPIVVKRETGPWPGLGPFLANGFSIKGIIPTTNTQLDVGPTVQPSADGWEFGTQISIPILTNCHEGETTSATLVIGFEKLGLSETITIPFTIQCLNELRFSRWTPPEHVPEGAWVTQDSDGKVTVNLSTENTYRFSELNIGEGGRLKVNYNPQWIDPYLEANPAVIEVTRWVSINDGEIQCTGENGSPGNNGSDYYHGSTHHVIGGIGGNKGFPHGSNGGEGGPNWLSSEDGLDGEGYGCFAGGSCGGDGGLLWEKGSWLSFLHDVYSFATDVVQIVASGGTAFTAYVAAIQDGYGAIQEGMKLWENDKKELLSNGGGGKAPSNYALPYSSGASLGGGGGGGGGKMAMEWAPDKAGGGGGGGGGGSPWLKIVTPGSVSIGVAWQGKWGSIIGTGGNGGHGGDGSGGWQGQAAPGGGGGGGNGAQIHIIAKSVNNEGTITLKGGLGGASGMMKDDGDKPSYFIKNSFGESGKNGILRVDGKYVLNAPQHANFYKGPDHQYNVFFFPSNSNYCTYFFLGDQVGWKKFCFDLQQGLNTIAANDIPLHPWQKQFIFYYPWQDSDGDGLVDPVETILGTNPNNPDSDGDGLTDGAEVYTHGTDPLKSDTDGDGYSDSYEIAHGSDPKNAADIPVNSLLVTKTGAGSGVVTSSPPGMDCGSTCQATYARHTEVTLQASPSPGSYFVEWTGNMWGEFPSFTTMIHNDVAVVANFGLKPILTVTKEGAGSGVVTSSPPGVDCGPTCQATYTPRTWTMVTLQASPSPGSYFAGWSGGCTGTNPSCSVWAGWGDITVVANFEPQKTLTVTIQGSGSGAVTSSPSGVDCGSACQAFFTPGTMVTLHAVPSPGYNFAGWSGGGCTGTNPWCSITIAADTTVVANFEPQKKLVVEKAGAGSGVVTSSPSGIDCGLTCEATFPPTVTLYASPSPGSNFAGWSGGECSGTASLCTITLTADTTVTANFEIYTPGALMVVGRENHTATLLPDGKVLLAGGWDGSGNILPSTELYDPATSTFSPAGSMGTGRVGHTATLLPNGKVLLAGGEESNNFTKCSSAELYDTITGTVDWVLFGGNMVGIHVGHTATFLLGTGWPYGTVLIIGGFDIPDYCDSLAELYLPDSDFFNQPENPYMASERAGHTATFLSNGKVLIAGGYGDTGNIHSSAEIFDPTDPISFFVTGSMATERAGHTATLLPDGKVLVVGGWGPDVPLSSAELYDPTTGIFSTTGSMATRRAGHTATLLPNGKVLIAGGLNSAYSTLSSAELYDPDTGIFSTTGSMTVARAEHTATLLFTGKVLIVGGYNGNDGVLSSAELYDPETGRFSPNVPNNNPSYSLIITRAGNGGGTVTSAPPGVDCGSICQATFTPGTEVTLQASASPGSYFTGWSGGGCSGTDPSCTVTLSANTNVDATFQLLSVSVVEDAAGDLLLKNCDSANPSMYCSIPPGVLSLPGYFDIKTARIAQISGEEVELSISLYEPIPLVPPYPFVNYYWQFQDGCVTPSPTDKNGLTIYWNGTTQIWVANWYLVKSCNPITVELGASVPFEFTADGIKVRVALSDLLANGLSPGSPLEWHAAARLIPTSHPTFKYTVPVDFAPNVMAFNPTPPPTFIYPEDEATWEPN